MSLVLDSTTFHYQVAGIDKAWPDQAKRYSQTKFRPDSLSFNIHVTRTGRVSWGNAHLDGFRVLKSGLSEHRVDERSYYRLEDLPGFAQEYINEALAKHGA